MRGKDQAERQDRTVEISEKSPYNRCLTPLQGLHGGADDARLGVVWLAAEHGDVDRVVVPRDVQRGERLLGTTPDQGPVLQQETVESTLNLRQFHGHGKLRK